MINQLCGSMWRSLSIPLGVGCEAGNRFPQLCETSYQLIQLWYAVPFVRRHLLHTKGHHFVLLRTVQRKPVADAILLWGKLDKYKCKKKSLRTCIIDAQKPKRKVTHKKMFLALLQAGTPEKDADGKPVPYSWDLYKQMKKKPSEDV